MEQISVDVAKLVVDRLNTFYQNAMVVSGLTAEQMQNVNDYVAVQQLQDISALGGTLD